MATDRPSVLVSGAILETVQRLRVFDDCKTFVDHSVRPDRSVDDIWAAFDALSRPLHAEQLRAFVRENFSPPGRDLISDEDLPDGTDIDTAFLRAVQSESARDLGQRLVGMWRSLYRRTDADVAQHPEKHSLIAMPRPFVVAGGRFRELYYWDSYWIVEGLLLCGMRRTASDMVLNLLSLVERFGHVPNGNRRYYLNRSQPPLLCATLALLHGDLMREDSEQSRAEGQKLLDHALPLLVREHEYFMRNRSVLVAEEWRLNVYNVRADHPRPESLREDELTALRSSSARASSAVYNDLASAAESGMDFSSRWLERSDDRSLCTVRTSRIVPVCLNSFLLHAERVLSRLFAAHGDGKSAERYSEASTRRLQAMNAVLWDGDAHRWRDYDLERAAHTSIGSESVAASDFFPLFAARGVDALPAGTSAGDVAHALRVSGLLAPGGVQTTTCRSGQQWDAPNAFPPIQDLVVTALEALGEAELAAEIAVRVVRGALWALQKDGHMHEKYNAEKLGERGEGGEYAPQVGFGWTNAVVLKFLAKYPAHMTEEALERL